MAKGFPDFFGQSQFPKYGALDRTYDFEVVPGDSIYTPINLTGQGVILACTQVIEPRSIADLADMYVRFTVDDTGVFTLNPVYLNRGEYVMGRRNFVHTTVYNVEDLRFAFETMVEIPFNESFSISWEVDLGVVDADFTMDCYYYLVL
jgi:hypothetical protein